MGSNLTAKFPQQSKPLKPLDFFFQTIFCNVSHFLTVLCLTSPEPPKSTTPGSKAPYLTSWTRPLINRQLNVSTSLTLNQTDFTRRRKRSRPAGGTIQLIFSLSPLQFNIFHSHSFTHEKPINQSSSTDYVRDITEKDPSLGLWEFHITFCHFTKRLDRNNWSYKSSTMTLGRSSASVLHVMETFFLRLWHVCITAVQQIHQLQVSSCQTPVLPDPQGPPGPRSGDWGDLRSPLDWDMKFYCIGG